MGAVKARMDNLLFKALLPAVVVGMAGCGRSSPDGPYVDLPDSATVISVNGACYAKSYVEQNVTVMANLMVLDGARTEDLEMTVDPIGYRFRLMNSMVERELLIQESAKRGISLDEADVRRRENQLAAEFTRFARICVRLAPLPEPSSVWADLPEPLPEDEESAYAAWLERLKQSATIKTAAL